LPSQPRNMLILNPSMTQDAEALEKLLKSLQSSFSQFSFFDTCAVAALGGSPSAEASRSFIRQTLAATFLEMANQVKYSAGSSCDASRPGSYESWVALLCGALEDSGVDFDTAYDSSVAPANPSAPADDLDGDGEAVEDDDAAGVLLSPSRVWVESEVEAVIDHLLSKRTLIEIPDMPFHTGCKVLALLREDAQWHPAVIQREVAAADMWEPGYSPPVKDAGPEDAATVEVTDEALAPAPAIGSSNADKKVGKHKSKAKAMKPYEIYESMTRCRFCEVTFTEFGKSQYARLDRLKLNEEVDDDEGVEGMLCEEGECEVCRRSVFLTFHHLIPKQTHNRWLHRKKMPEGVKGYESGSRKKMPSSAVKAPPSGSKKPAGGRSLKERASTVDTCDKKAGGLLNRHFLNTYGIMVCRQCHSQIHHMASNMELAKRYSTLQRVLDAPLMQGSVGVSW